jgi:hypothetical protein
MLVPEENERVTLHATVVGHAGSPDEVAPDRHWVTVALTDGQHIQTNLANLTLKRTKVEVAEDAAAEVAEQRADEPEDEPSPRTRTRRAPAGNV